MQVNLYAGESDVHGHASESQGSYADGGTRGAMLPVHLIGTRSPFAGTQNQIAWNE